MRKWMCFFYFIAIFSYGIATESISGKDRAYRDICLKASYSPKYFKTFRSIPQYAQIVEPGDIGDAFAGYLLENASDDIMKRLPIFEKLESIGKPQTRIFPNIGKFSGTTLRYIMIADHLTKLFSLPHDAKIVEIGAGFGGQCYILSSLISFSNYYIYDLPEVEVLINKVMERLTVPNVTCLPFNIDLPEEPIDLVISNYAFSECNKTIQLDYFNKVIKKSIRGYMIYNQIAESLFGNDYLSPYEFFDLLEKNGMHPKIYPETISTHKDNLLIVWDNSL